MMQHLLRRLVFDVPLLNEHTKMPLKVRKTTVMLINSDKNINLTLYYLSLDIIHEDPGRILHSP